MSLVSARVTPGLIALLALIGCAFVFLLANGSEASAQAQKSSQAQKSLAYDVRFVGDENITRIILDFTQKPDFKLFYMTQPNRLVIEVDNGVFQLDDAKPLTTIGLVNAARAGSITASKARMVVSLSNPVKLSSKDLQVFEGSTRHRLVLELAKATEDEFLQALNEQQALLGSSGSTVKKGGRVRPVEKKKGEFIIVLDPGHGGIDGGAVGKRKTIEKNITLNVGKRVKQYLSAYENFRVVLTRESDVFLSLKERLAITKRNNADLMISIHADTLKQRNVRGATIYTLAKKASDRLSAQLAESENLADVVAGLAAPSAKDEVTDILADLTLRETTKFSKTFSGILKKRLAQKVTLIKNPQRAASFAVLKNLEVPSVLLELGYLSNTQDELLFNDPKWQEEISRQIVAGVVEFFDGRTATLQ